MLSRLRAADQRREPPQDLLLPSEDAGANWREIFRRPADVLGLVVSSDGTRVRVGLGDARDEGGKRPVDRSVLGLYEATAPTFDFTRKLRGQVGCLTESGQDLFLCGAHGSEGFELGISHDGGRSAQAMVDFGGVRGPLACPNTSTRSDCGADWAEVCATLGMCPQPEPSETSNASSDKSGVAPRHSATTQPSGGCTVNAGKPGRGSRSPERQLPLGLSLLGLVCLVRYRRGKRRLTGVARRWIRMTAR